MEDGTALCGLFAFLLELYGSISILEREKERREGSGKLPEHGKPKKLSLLILSLFLGVHTSGLQVLLCSSQFKEDSSESDSDC